MSTVVLSNIPYGCQESDIHRALLMYGTAMDIHFDPQTSQAVVTMRNMQEAQALLNRHAINVIGSTVRVDPMSQPCTVIPAQPPISQQAAYSSSHYYNMPGAAGAPTQQIQAPSLPQTSQQQQQQQQQQQRTPYTPDVPAHASGPVTRVGANYMPTNRLRIVVEDCRYTITRDVLMQMFSMIAAPTHVYCGSSGPITTGSVEFSDVASAERAMQQFNNQNIYPGCCFVNLSYDHLPSYQQSDNARGTGGSRGGGYYDNSSMPHPNSVMPYPMQPPPPPPPEHALPDIMFPTNPPGMFRGGRGLRGGANSYRGGGGRGGSYYSADMGGVSFDPFSAYAPRGGYGGGRHVEEVTVVISNVAESVSLYDLWVLLEVYGNVNSLRRHFKDKTSVSAQFQHATDAKTAVFYLQNCSFRGHTMGVKLFSGYVERGGKVEWNAGPATDPATQAVIFSSGYHHRTKPSAPFNPLSRVRPDKNLFVSNLVESITDDDLKNAFAKVNCPVVKYYRKNVTVSIVGFKDTDTSIDALVAVHGKQLKDRYLRITFSRFPPEPMTTAEGEQNNLQEEEESGSVEGQREEPGQYADMEVIDAKGMA